MLCIIYVAAGTIVEGAIVIDQITNSKGLK